MPGKNVMPVLGRPLMAYPLLAAQGSKYVDRMYVSSDSDEIMAVGREYGAESIIRPPELCTDEALGEDAYRHGYFVIKERLAEEGEDIEMIALLFANAATISSELIDQGIEILRADPELDSAVTVSRYNMWSPLRARKLGEDGTLQPFVPFETFGDPETLSCDRDSQGDVWYADMGVSIVRPRCLEEMHFGILPQRWMGRRIAPIESWGGCDIDYPWQLPAVEYWLREHGIEEARPAAGVAASETR